MSIQDHVFLFQRLFSSSVRRRAPGVVLLLLVIPCLSIGTWYHPSVLFLIVLLVALLVLTGWMMFLRERHRWMVDIMLVVLLVAGAIFSSAVHTQFPVIDPSLTTADAHHAIVETNPVQEGMRWVFTVRPINQSTKRVGPYRIRVYADSLFVPLWCGDVVALHGAVRIPSRARNPGGFNARAFFLRRGIQYRMYLRGNEIHKVAHGVMNPVRQFILSPAQTVFSRSITERLAKPYSSLLLALTVGQRGDVPEELRALFSDAGIIHILAVSGLHVGIIVFFLLMVLRSLRVRFEMASLIICIFIVFYALMVDLRPPVVRATVMFIFVMLGLLTQKRIQLLNIVACSAVLILIFRPADLFDPGFQLSYVATFSIVLFHRHIVDWFPRWMRDRRVVNRFLVLPFAVSLSAQLGTAPIIAFHFFKCSLVAPLSNIIIVPFVFLGIPAGFLMIAGEVVHPLLGKMLAGVCWLLLHCIMRISAFFGSLPWGAMWVRRPGIAFFVLYYGSVVSFFAAKGRKRLVAVILLTLVTLNVIVYARLWHAYHPRMWVHFLDVGQGDGVVVEYPDRTVAVIDGGTRSSFVDYGERVLLPFLRSRGIRKIHAVIATHPDVDHYGGLLALLKNMEVGCLLVNGEEKPSKLYRFLLEIAEEKGIPVYAVHRGQVVHLGRTPLYVLHPPCGMLGLSYSSNERSIVMKCGYGSKSFLFTGDYPNGALRIPFWCLNSAVLKFPHHGASMEDPCGFLEQVKPVTSIISVGEGNPFGHPDPLNIQLLRMRGSSIYRTDMHGCISIGTDGERFFTKTTLR